MKEINTNAHMYLLGESLYRESFPAINHHSNRSGRCYVGVVIIKYGGEFEQYYK